MSSLTEKLHASGFILSEGEGTISRDNGVLITGQNLGAGTVLGKITVNAGAGSVAAPAYVGTGNGGITMDAVAPVQQGAKVGAYTATCIVAAANSGTFRVEDPDGYVLGDVVVAAVFNDDIKFVINDGAVDYIVGDKFTITVTAGSGKYTILAPAALDGSHIAAAVLVDAVDATLADVAGAVVTRLAEVNGNELIYPGGITAPQKATAIAQMQALGIIVR